MLWFAGLLLWFVYSCCLFRSPVLVNICSALIAWPWVFHKWELCVYIYIEATRLGLISPASAWFNCFNIFSSEALSLKSVPKCCLVQLSVLGVFLWITGSKESMWGSQGQNNLWAQSWGVFSRTGQIWVTQFGRKGSSPWAVPAVSGAWQAVLLDKNPNFCIPGVCLFLERSPCGSGWVPALGAFSLTLQVLIMFKIKVSSALSWGMEKCLGAQEMEFCYLVVTTQGK